MPIEEESLPPETPRSVHWSSDRAVFRLQRYSVRFLNDLKLVVDDKHQFENFDRAILIPVDPRSERYQKEKSGDHQNKKKFYRAKFCRTYAFTNPLCELLKALFDKQGISILRHYDGIVPAGLESCKDINGEHFEKLFQARDELARKAGRSLATPTYQDFVAAINDGKKDKAHEIFVETVSNIPYSGMLPTALDEVVEQLRESNPELRSRGYSIGFKPDGDDEWDFFLRTTTLKWPKEHSHRDIRDHLKTNLLRFFKWVSYRRFGSNGSQKENKAILPKLAIPIISADEKLPLVLRHFVNPFLLAPDWQEKNGEKFPEPFPEKFSGLAIPLYENTRVEKSKSSFEGAYLGWIIVLKNNPDPCITVKDEDWPLVSILLNRLAASVLTAMSDELVSDYADHADQEPLQYLKSRIEDMEGFTDKKESYHTGEPDIVWDLVEDNNIKVNLWKKRTTVLPQDKKKYKDQFLVPRLERTLRQLKAVHLSTQAETMRKYKQMMELLSSPLRNLTESLADIQRDTQELRAILYEPAQTIFESYQRISELFEDGKRVQISRYMTISIIHDPFYYREQTKTWSDDPASIENGRLCMITAVCRIFGQDSLVQDARNFKEFLSAGKFALCRVEEPAFVKLREDLRWLWKVANDGQQLSNIESMIDASEEDDGAKMRNFLEAIKAVAFSPFKVETDKWNVRAIQLAMPDLVRDDPNKFLINGNEELDLGSYSPASYHTILGFLLGMSGSDDSRIPGLCKIDKIETDYTIHVEYSGSFHIDKTKLDDIKRLIHGILESPRDWRIQGANQGNFLAPFVYLANRLLGIVPNAHGLSIPAGGWDFSEGRNNEVIALESWHGRQFVVSIWDDTNGKGVLEIKWVNKSPVDLSLTPIPDQIRGAEPVMDHTIPSNQSSEPVRSSDQSFKCHLLDHQISSSKPNTKWANAFNEKGLPFCLPYISDIEPGNSLDITDNSVIHIVFLHTNKDKLLEKWRKKAKQNRNLHIVLISTGKKLPEHWSDRTNRFYTCYWMPNDVQHETQYEIKCLLRSIKDGDQEWPFWLQERLHSLVKTFEDSLKKYIQSQGARNQESVMLENLNVKDSGALWHSITNLGLSADVKNIAQRLVCDLQPINWDDASRLSQALSTSEPE